jgi:hypothetical protein
VGFFFTHQTDIPKAFPFREANGYWLYWPFAGQRLAVKLVLAAKSACIAPG